MPKRPIQHQIEDESRAKYELAIPKEWVFRNKEKDYGIDGEVEIFTPDQMSTGLIYFVQLKATASEEEQAIKKLSMKLDLQEYYRQLPVPVMIARYSSEMKIFFVKWAHEIDPYYAKERAETITVKFTDNDKWDNQGSPKRVKQYLERIRALKSGALRLPISCFVQVDSDVVCGIKAGALLSELRQKLRGYGQLVKVRLRKDDAIAYIKINAKRLYVGLANLTHSTFHDIDNIKVEDTVNELATYSLLGLAGATAKLGYNDLAANIALTDDLKDDLLEKLGMFKALLPPLLSSQSFKKILDMANIAAEKDDSNLVDLSTQLIASHLVDKSDYTKKIAFEDFMLKALERSKSHGPESYGHSLYNLGSYYRSGEDGRKAIKYYLRARRHQPVYLKQGYYYAELAGLFFDIRKYCVSSTFYGKALELDSNESWIPLYADALMHSGKYKEAHAQFCQYLECAESINHEWLLKHFVLGCLLSARKVESQVRNYKKATLLADTTNITDPDEAASRREEALAADLLNPLAWYNYAQDMFKTGNFEEAAFGFILCALINRYDPPTWANAVSCCMSKSIPTEIVVSVLVTAYKCSGDEFLDYLYENYEKSGQDIAPIAEMVETFIVHIPEDAPQAPVRRIMNRHGKMVDMSKCDPSDFIDDKNIETP
ncbi:DUF4365 domain-containing protein [Pseudodesulfovibrio sp.]|uniref:DUF4365 domain-containing protein n=1 Tax=unclassified Pseudodesulfovibrio TaxID=2661612 RepID=UPI003B004115